LPPEEGWRPPKDPNEPLRIAFLGRLAHAQKGVLHLPEILDRAVRNGIRLCLTIVGDGPDRNSLVQKFDRLGLQDIVDFRGTVDQEEIYPLLLDSHVLLMPSIYEGLGIAALEAQMCGCVPVASRLEGITDAAIADGETGFLVSPGEIDGFVRAIRRIADSPATWSRMSRAAHARAANLFSIESMGNGYLQIIEAAVAGQYPLPRSRRRSLPVNPALIAWRDDSPPALRRMVRWLRRSLRRLIGRP